MKTTTRSRIYLSMAGLILSLALISPAAAQNQVPFKGTIQGHDTDTGSTSTTVSVATNGTGIATELGDFTFTLQNTVNPTTGAETGSAQFVAANGDIIDATFVGSGEPVVTPNGVVFSITEIYTITGGTGRFMAAHGGFTMERLASPTTFLTSGTFHGAITSPGAAR